MKGFRRTVIVLVLVLDVLLVALFWRTTAGPPRKVDDRVGIIPAFDERKYNEYLVQVQSESGIDVRIALVPDTRGQPLEQFALRAMRELDVGRETGGRGLLIVYDTLAHAMRIEVGPKLEGILPDAFVGYLMREHVDAFFGGGRPELGLRTTLFMVHWRIRMARLGEEYDPSFEEYMRDVRRLASGGGASGRIARDSGVAGFINTSGDAAASAYFLPQPSVEAAYRRHHEWLAMGGGQVDVPLFTPASQTYLRRLPMSPAFNAYLLATEFGRRYTVDQRGDLAMLYYTDDPFLSPKFFRRTADGWQMDVFAEVANSQEAAGFWYTWRLRVSGDDFSRVFADRYTPMAVPGVDDFYRVAGGDNRALTIRGNASPVESELHRPKPAGARSPPDSGAVAVEYLTVREVAERVRNARGRPAVVVLYGTWNEQTRGQFSEIVRVARSCREQGVEFLAFQKDANPRAVADLPVLLARHRAPFPPLQLHPWRSGLLDATMGELGIRVGRQWRPPLVAVLDRDGRVVRQAQGVTDWEAVQAACRSVAGDAVSGGT
jgi:uncharacterized protein